MKHKIFLNIAIAALLTITSTISIADDNNSSLNVKKTIGSVGATNGSAIELSGGKYTRTQHFSAAMPVDMSLAGITLHADSGSLLHDADFYAETLDKAETHPLKNDMTVVTGSYYAYRLLPHGEHFSDITPAHILLSYNPSDLPHGFKAQEIHTYYYDEHQSSWQELRRLAVDTVAHVIISETTHFTDFVNAVITTPEIPEVSAFTPTQISEMEEPHPLTGVPMIASPQANTYGTAEITYPIDIPSGRNGLQPDINLHYSSANGNGLLGYGWSLQQPAVSIDTRWGVPRYSTNYETEIYTIDGMQIVQKDGNPDLLLPYQTNTQLLRQTGDITFIARDTKNCDLIVRHGTTPQDYWWSVTDRSGIVKYYGKYSSDTTINTKCVLTDDKGNIAYWALAEVVDLYGNYIRYEYNVSNHDIYPKNIYYTGHKKPDGIVDFQPTYRIFFHYMERNDILQDGRWGFIRQTDSLMCYIDISDIIDTTSENALVTNHRFIIHYGDSTETLITKINDFPYHWNNHWSTSGDCYSDINGWYYGPMVNSCVDFKYYKPSPDEMFGEEHVISNSEAIYYPLSKSSSNSWNLGGTATVGFGSEYISTNLSAGGNYNYSQSKGKTEQMLMDMNGDGLTDLVYLKNNHIYYRPQRESDDNIYFDDEINTGIQSSGLTQDISHTNTWGLQAGAEIIGVGGANISGGMSYTNTYTTNYFADINADGLPDYIDNGKIYFNRLNSYSNFAEHDVETPVIIDSTKCNGNFIYNHSVDIAPDCYVIDTVLGYYTPEECYFNIIRPTIVPAPNYQYDSTCYKIEQQKVNAWKNTIIRNYPNAQFEKQDNDIVAYINDTVCSPKIDPDFEVVRVWVAPKSGTVSLHSTIHLIQDTSENRRQSQRADGVMYVIQHNSGISPDTATQTLSYQSKEKYLKSEILENEYDTLTNNYSNISVSRGDIFFFHLMSKRTHQFDNVDWQQTIIYNDSTIYSSTSDFVCSGNEVFQSPYNGMLKIDFAINCASGCSAELLMNGTGEQPVTITDTTHSFSKNISYTTDSIISFKLSPLSGNLGGVEVRPHLYFTPTDTTLQAFDQWLAPHVEITPSDSFHLIYHDLFGSLYKGWGQFVYNNTEASDTIPLSQLVNKARLEAKAAADNPDQPATENDYLAMVDSMCADSLQWQQRDGLSIIFKDKNLYNPLDNVWVPMTADASSYRYEGYGQVVRCGRNIMSNTRDKQNSLSRLSDTGLDSLQERQFFDIEFDDDVPVMSNGQPAMAVRKEARSVQWNVNAGASVMAIGTGITHSQSDYEVTTDFMDMNGDRYPDVVRSGSIQYSEPWGALGESRDILFQSYSNHSKTTGLSLSGHYGTTQKLSGNKPTDGKYLTSVNGSVDGSGTISNSESRIAYIDLNADGLPDKIILDNDTIYAYLNIGYGFAPARKIDYLPFIDKNTSIATGASLSSLGNIGWGEITERLIHVLGITSSSLSSSFQMSIVFGVNVNLSDNTIQYRLADMDGDGLPDIVCQNGNDLIVILTKYYGTTRQSIVNDEKLQESKSLSIGVNAGLTIGFPVWSFIKMNVGINGSPWGSSYTRTTRDLIDMNGDGLPDLVWSDNDGIHVRYNQMGRKNLLHRVYNSTSQIYELDYTLSDASTEQRGRQWLLTEVRDILPQHSLTSCDTISRRFVYSDPYYYAAERTSLGYGSVETHEMNTGTHPNTIYRKQKRRYNNKDFAEHGKLIYEALTDSLNRKYTEYRLDSLTYIDDNGHVTTDLCNDVVLKLKKEAHITTYFSPEQNDSIVTAKEYEYDKYHNVVAYRNLEDIALPDDDLTAAISYADATSGTNKQRNLISLPEHITILNAGVPTRRNNAEYNLFGKLIEYQTVDLLNEDSLYQTCHYDNFGMPDYFELPDNHRQQRAEITVKYDSYSHSLPALISDQWERSTASAYHHFWQKPISVTDAAGNTLRYDYDRIGRLQYVRTPLDSTEAVTYQNLWGQTVTDTLPTATITYQYNNCMDLRRKNSFVESTIIPRHRNVNINNYSDTEDTIRTRTDFDRRGRAIMHKEERADEYWVANNITSVDAFGRTTATYKPYFAGNKKDTLKAANLQLLFTETYDVLDRQISHRWQDNTQQLVNFGIGQDAHGAKRLMQQYTDENGNTRIQYVSPQGKITTSVAPDNSTTSFVYDAFGQLLASTDPDGMTTTHTYDGYGRRTQRIHPDAGTTRWTYDHAGNMIASQTQSQINNNLSTTYHYTYDRLDSVCYPQYPQTNIYYQYDTAGRISQRTDLTGVEKFQYDQLGNISQSERLIAVPTERQAYRFTTEYDYDVLGKINYIFYPDNSTVRYRYEHGLLDNISFLARAPIMLKSPPMVKFYPYISDFEYDTYDRPVAYIQNKCSTELVYDPNRSWLYNKYIRDDNKDLMDLYYEYDGVGNITSVMHDADSIRYLGGAYLQEFQYDAQNRLTRADMLSDYFGEYSNYNLTYSPSGMVGIKSCDDMLWNYWYGFCSINNHIASHQVRSIYDLENDETSYLLYNPEGQVQNIFRPCTGEFRTHRWTEAGQLAGVTDNDRCGYYGYDGNGDRVYKLTGYSVMEQMDANEPVYEAYFSDAVLYVNPYFVVTPKGYTKHIYNGSQRVATHLGTTDLQECIDTTASGRERLNNAREYMHALLYQTDEIPIDRNERFVDIDGDDYDELQWQCTDYESQYLIVNIEEVCDSDMLLPTIQQGDPTVTDVFPIYFYHSDHLGSATWITDYYGNVKQFLHYMPYGELFLNQQTSHYNERFKFTGKERDTETNYDYFGARYYSSDLTAWLSPDPLLDKYPSINPYAYCNWNPVKYVDKEGKWIETAWDLFNVGLDIQSLTSNIQTGDINGAIIDAAGLILDAAAVVLPVVPAGVGAAVKSARVAEKASTNITKATKHNYRQALQQATGKIGKGYEAHHTLPQKYRSNFEKLELNIDEPGNVVWRKAENHRANNHQHEKAWDDFFRDIPNPTKDQILKQREKIEQTIWKNNGDIPLY